jgi:AI-2 transport protein TqsA
MTDGDQISEVASTKSTKVEARPNLYSSIAFWHHLLVVVLVVFIGLYYAASFLIPLSVASLIFVLLTAIIDRIARLRPAGRALPRWVAQLLGLFVVLLGLGGIVAILANQADEVVASIPRYQERLGQIIAQVVQFAGEDLTSRATTEVENMNLSGLVGKLVGSAGSFLSGFVMVLLYIPFMMAERLPMSQKITLAASTPEMASEFGGVLRSISVGLQRYIGTKTLVSLLTGVLSYAVMKPVGLDFAETWGVLTFTLNFIPTIGSAVAVAIPAIVALVQFESLTPFLIIIAGCGAIQFVVGNILEPKLTGKSLNLSPLMVILALTAWTTLWGIAGALLSVPITVCVLIIFANIRDARPWAILMSGDGSLTSEGDKQNTMPEKSLPLGVQSVKEESD